MHLTVRIVNGALQADNHLMIKTQCGIYACRVIRSFPGWCAALPGQPAGPIPLYGWWPIRDFRRVRSSLRILRLLVRQMLFDRDTVARDIGRYTPCQFHTMG